MGKQPKKLKNSLDNLLGNAEKIVPECPHFGSCGGCSMQNFAYEKALKAKEQAVFDLFASFKESAKFYPVIPSMKIWRYRNKMEFSFSQNKAGDHFLGLFLKKSRGKVLNVERCPISPEWMTEGLELCKDFWKKSELSAYNYRNNTGHLRTITFRESPYTDDRMCILTVSGNADFAITKDKLDLFVRSMSPLIPPKQGKLSIILRIHQILKGSPTQIYEMKLLGDDYLRERVVVFDKEFLFHISPQAFFQPNSDMASILYERSLVMAELDINSVVYDLYCGIGSFGLLCAHRVKQVVGIELSADSAYDAKVNAERLGIANYRIIKGDVGAILQQRDQEPYKLPHPDCVLLDPPRSGLDKRAIQEIILLKPKKIVYISCNPVTQAQDIGTLNDAGYTLRSIQPLDQFPHTPHIENIAVLTAD